MRAPRWVPDKCRPVLRKAKRAGLYVLTLFHYLANGRQIALPPPGLRAGVGSGDFHVTGAFNVRNIKRFTPVDGKNVLEIGCGSGRNALALTSYDIRYRGFDIHRPYVIWCAEHISPHFPHFQFDHADIYNGQYNPSGKARSEEYRFALADASFDLVILTSVFTHMLEAEVRHYVSEIARLLKPGGHVYATAFLLNEEAERLIAAGRSSQAFKPFDGHNVKIVSREMPEAAVGYDEPIMVDAMRSQGLQIEAIKYGQWCGRSKYFDYQDVIFAKRI